MFTTNAKDEAAECAKRFFQELNAFRREPMRLALDDDCRVVAEFTYAQLKRCKSEDELRELFEVEFAIALIKGAGS